MRPVIRRLLAVSLVSLAVLLGMTPANEAAAVSKKDKTAAEAAYKLGEKAKWTEFERRAKSVKDPLLKKVLRWYRLQARASGASFEEISAFIEAEPEWPRQRRLLIRAEQAMKASTDRDLVLAWFAKHPPLTPNGVAWMAGEKLLAGSKDDAIRMVKDVWVSGNFGFKQERHFHQQFRQYMTLDDHLNRLDRLLWDGKYYPVRRMYRRFKDPKYRALAEARLTLRRMRGGVDRAIEKVPAELQDHPGLVYERLRWRRRKGRDQHAMALLQNPPDDLIEPGRWWTERAILARRALRNGHISDAYRLTKDHRLDEEDAGNMIEAEWMSGWIALRFLKDNKVAYEHFSKIYGLASYPISQARGAYWAGRAAEALGDAEKAAFWYRTAFLHETTYYGQLAAAKIPDAKKLALPASPKAGGEIKKTFEKDELVAAVRTISNAGLREIMRPFIRQLSRKDEREEWQVLTAALAKAEGRNDLAVLVSKAALRDGIDLVEEGYPVLKHKFVTGVEPAFVHAIIRQESAFNPKAISHAGARGLMQIMPQTARQVAKQNSKRYSRRKLTEDEKYNLGLGQAYLRDLLKEFNDSYILTLAAYNAGPHRAKRWIKRHGDPRDKTVDAIDWVEMIPITETRNYVQRVIENLHVYRQLLTKKEVAFNPEGALSR